jgi:prephenate dehydrogenase
MTAAEITVDVEDKPGIIASIAVALAARDINIKNIGINHVREEDEGALLIRFESPEERDFATDVLTGAGYGVKCRA